MSSSKRADRAPLVLLPVAAAAVLLVLSGTGKARPTLRGVARHPNAVDVLVNKEVRLPVGFKPRDLVVPNVRFIFSGFDEKRADGACPASSCFAESPAARWLAAHAARYGFVIRYPANGEASTGCSYEPWHLRYLGRPLARELAASHLTYEEFLGARGAIPGLRTRP
jgi:LAS superfamily LD-carboxypeptidase LdcB